MCPRKPWNILYHDTKSFNFLSVRALIHWLSTLCIVYSLHYIPIVAAISIFYLWSIFSIVLSHCIHGFGVNAWDIALCVIGCGGAIMIVDPTFCTLSTLSTDYIEGVVLIVTAALFYSLNVVSLRKKRGTFHWTQTESVNGLWGTFCFTPIYVISAHFLFDIPIRNLFDFTDQSPLEWTVFIAISLSAFCVVGGVTRALQLDSTINVNIVMYSQIGFAILFQYLLLNDTSNFDTIGLWLGLCVVIGSTLLIEYRRERVSGRRWDGNRAFRKEFSEGDMIWSPRRFSRDSCSEKMHLIDPTEMKSREHYGAMTELYELYAESALSPSWNVQER